MRYVYDKTFVDFCYVPMGWDCVFDIRDVKVVVFDLAFFDEVICYADNVVAVVNVGQFVYLSQALFSEGVDYDSISVLCRSCDVFYESADVEEVVMFFLFAACHFFVMVSDSMYDKHFRETSVAKQI